MRTPPEMPTSTELRETVAEALGIEPEQIDEEANLVLLGLGSLDMMRLISRWRRSGLKLALADLVAEPTLEAWLGHLTRAWERATPASGAQGTLEQVAR